MSRRGAASRAVDSIFDRAATDAVHDDRDDTLTNCRVIVTEPDTIVEFNAARTARSDRMIEVRASEIPTLEKGHRFALDDETVEVTEKPHFKDSLRLVHVCGIASVAT